MSAPVPSSYDEEPIERYLDALVVALPGPPRSVRRTVAEAEAHLHDAAEAQAARGLEPGEATEQAIADFGGVGEIAAASRPFGLIDLVRPAALVTGVGLVAVGLSGALSWMMTEWWGSKFVAGDLPGSTYDAARCRELSEYAPGRDCLAAAAQHHAGEVVTFRLTAGVLGLLFLLAWHLAPRRRRLPCASVPGLLALMFGGAALLLAGATIDASGGSWSGAGQWLSAGLVAATAAVAFGIRCRAEVLRPACANATSG